jgi:hypothetical protein
VEGVPPELLERYFDHNGDNYMFSKELRRSVIFGPHNLIRDAPIPRIDLLVCRNTLMYLNAETQSQVLARFSFALREGGYLLLGKAEMLLAHSDLFTSVDLKRRVFRKVPGATLRERLMVLTDAGERPVGSQRAREERILPAAGAALQDPAGLPRPAPLPGRRGRVADAFGRGRPPGSAGRPAARRPAGAARGQYQLRRRDPVAPL